MTNPPDSAASTSAKVLQFLEETRISEVVGSANLHRSPGFVGDVSPQAGQLTSGHRSSPSNGHSDGNGRRNSDSNKESKTTKNYSSNMKKFSSLNNNSSNGNSNSNSNINSNSNSNSNSYNNSNSNNSNNSKNISNNNIEGNSDQNAQGLTNNINNNNKYKRMLRYKPNTGFKDEVSSVNGLSVPNTFKHKSHPNAQTKTQIGTSFQETSAENALESVLDELSDNAIKTSTLRNNPGSANNENKAGSADNENKAGSADNETPHWMPSVLETPWDEASQTATSKSKDMPLNFLTSNSNTFVHNANAAENGAHTTPMWRKVNEGYQSKIASDPPLHNIFQSYFDQSKDDSKATHGPKAGVSGFTSVSTISTPIASKDSETHLTESQIVQLENMLEQVKDQPDDYPVVGSPLKLFGNAYDTFTKSVLSQFVEKVRSNANSVQRNSKAPPSLPKFELRISDFTKSKNYTDKDFMKNADNIFAHLQKKGHATNHHPERTSAESLHQPSLSLIHNQNTATSTPKPNRIRSFTSSSSSPHMTVDSESDLDPRSPVKGTHDYEYSVDEYTVDDKSSSRHELPRAGSHAAHYNSYTFDKASDLNSEYTSESSDEESGRTHQDMSKETEDSEVAPYLGNSMSSVRMHPKEEERKLSSNFIRWKRPSQLRLSSAVNIRRNSVVKGLVKPGKYPDQYGNMILDPREHKWVSNDKENSFRGSLDSIEDLATSLEPLERAANGPYPNGDSSILKRPSMRKRPDQNLEVSFQLPESSVDVSSRSKQFDVTAVSALTNDTFSQSNKDIVSLITGATDEAVWDKIHTIVLAGKNITHLESLDYYLPSLQSVNLSQNKLAFIDGLPTCVSELDVSGNMLDSRASFRKLRDLQILNASFNRLETLSGLSASYNLTQLNIMGNSIRSIDDLKPLRSLISLNISRNNIQGKLDLAQYNFANLQELNLAENLLTSIQGIEHAPKLRILNINENRLSKLSCHKRHTKLKKLCLKFNALSTLEVEEFPFLRVLRIDGNRLAAVRGLKKLRFLQEISAKCQMNSEVVSTIFEGARDVITMDFSGVTPVDSVFRNHLHWSLFNLNVLNLSAVGLSTLPSQFGDMFPNVRELNLNFNRFESLSGLASLTRLRKLFILSNNMSSMENLITSLQKSRKSLAVLDARLNALNFRFYPYVFSPDELEHHSGTTENVTESPIPIRALDDIENFSIHYKAVTRSKEDWQDRDRAFFSSLVQEGKKKHVQDRISYESLMLEFFTNLKELDGTRVSVEQRVQIRQSSRGMQERNAGGNRAESCGNRAESSGMRAASERR